MRKKVAIQGVRGAFHQEAARNFFGSDIEIFECLTFKELVESVERGKTSYGIIAVENSLVGGILPNYALIRESALTVIGEVYLRIVQNLMALPNQTIDSILEVQSHPMALAQCDDFLLQRRNLRVVASDDTALSAKLISENNLAGVAAIGSVEAAKEYGLEIIAPSIESNKANYTRFMVLSPEQNNDTQIKTNKASIAFALPHKSGSLQNALQSFSRYGINLTMLHSLPQVGQCWEYYFHADVVFRHIDDFNLALKSLKNHTNYLRVIGVYSTGNFINKNSTN
ncbi:MAG TPA: prephenate dehydratase [Tenuifilaceae bacterium]|nr:prephenate dehydratase [Tenuifilaceae bacterium]HOZ15675.1 prephenate dehydratase [Tenuifilaceae bacterium]HPI44701.1 prephenate dehydratase [Tenuifilaceae bacterium]HPN20892.1 prephenate dehydratase [Tenuifilaceae bacterium]